MEQTESEENEIVPESDNELVETNDYQPDNQDNEYYTDSELSSESECDMSENEVEREIELEMEYEF